MIADRLRHRLVAVTIAAVSVMVLVGCLDPTTGRPPPPGASAPAFRSSVATVTAASLGASWRPGCPVGPADLRAVTVDHWGYDGKRHTGTIVVHRAEASSMQQVFRTLYAQRFQIERISPVSVFGGDDDRSMAANNTSAFNCRRVTGGSGWSEHSYGRALDLNPVQNPYVKGATILPPSGKPWADRTVVVPGMVHAGDPTVRAFAAIGWRWGGNWSSLKDYQHFSRSGR